MGVKYMDIEVARQYYYEREMRRRALREAERQRWLQRVREAVACIASRYSGVRQVYAFGSLVQPGNRKRVLAGTGAGIGAGRGCASIEWRDSGSCGQ
jgi:hypothetical protein